MNRQSLSRRLKRLSKLVKEPLKKDYTVYRNDPAGFARDVLNVQLTDDQEAVVNLILESPRRTLVSSGHSVGKTLLGAVLVLWWFYTRKDGLCLTTAPTKQQVCDLLWKEVRLLHQRARLPDNWVGPKIPRLESNAGHWAHGFTANDATGFAGRHSPGGLLIIFDEAEGVDESYWQALKTMLDDSSIFVAFYNPTTQGSAPQRAEEQADEHGLYNRITLSCVNHPNIEAGLNDQPIPIPGAITVGQLRHMLLEDSTRIPPGEERLDTDVVLGDEVFRPGPVAQARCLGVRPSQSSTGLWSPILWNSVLNTRHPIQAEWPVTIGCDVGRYGDDSTVIFVRKGFKIVRSEVHVRLDTKQVAERLRYLCYEFEDAFNKRLRIPVNIDEGGVGAGVIDQREGHRFIPVNASRKARNTSRYSNIRSELWFNARSIANEGLMDLSDIPDHILRRLKQELLAAQYQVLAGTDKLVVSQKSDMKKLLGRSPDVADAFNLCFYPVV